MSETPDLSTLPNRMRGIANRLVDVYPHLGAENYDAVWNVKELLHQKADDIEARAAVELDQLVRDMQSAVSPNFGLAQYIDVAKHLIARGWTKAANQ